MNKLSPQVRAMILHLLCEGNSIRSVVRLTGASKNTVVKLLNDAGKALGDYQGSVFVNLPCKNVQVDEIWTFTAAKQKNVAKMKAPVEGAGDTWTWTAICADTKLVFSSMVGGRDSDYAAEFMMDVASRVAGRIQLTSDGHGPYAQAVREAFGPDVDYAQLVKIYGNSTATPVKGTSRYSPPPLAGIKKRRVIGSPDMEKVSTSFVERQNLTMRMHMRRFTRLTNGFSKRRDAHANAIALHFAYYNFVRIHQTLRVTPAMTAGVTERLWEIADLVAIIDAAEGAPKKRGPYKKRQVA